MLARRNGKNVLCSVTKVSSIFLMYNKFIPIDCHGLCNSAVNIHLNEDNITPPNKMSAKKRYFTINYIHNKQSVSDCIYIYQSVSLSPSSQSVPSSSPHLLLTCPSSLMSFHNKSSFPSTALLK